MPRAPSLLAVTAALVSVFALSSISVALSPESSDVAAFWPAAGVGTALLALTRPRAWSALVPALVLVSAAGNLLSGREATVSLLFGVANVTENLVTAVVLGALVRRPWLRTRRDLGRLVTAGLAGALTAGVLVAGVVALLGDDDFVMVVADVAASHGASELLVLPAALLLRDPQAVRPHASRGWASIAVVATLAVFVLTHLESQTLPVAFVPFVLLVASAQVLSLRALSLLALACAFVVTLLTAYGGGPFPAADVGPDVVALLVQLDLLVIALVCYPLGIAVAQSVAATDALRREQSALREALEREGRAVDRLEQLNQMKSEFLMTVTHEIRTPLTSIQGFTELLLSGSAGPVADAQRTALQRIDRGGRRLRGLVDNVLSTSTMDAVALREPKGPVDVATVLASVTRASEHLLWDRDLVLDVHIGTSPMEVTGDAHDLERALLNLVRNSITFTRDGGRVEVSAQLAAHDDPGGTLRAHPTHVDITVCDTGVGISTADQEHLFERFYRCASARSDHAPGTGLGLSTVRAVVEDHGGHVSLTSRPGAGTQVLVRLPLASTVASSTS